MALFTASRKNMRKVFILVLIFISLVSFSQDGGTSVDTVAASPGESTVEEEGVKITGSGSYAEEDADTILYYHRRIMDTDSVRDLKASKKYAWAKNIDSLLKAEKERLIKEEAAGAKAKDFKPRERNGSWLGDFLNSDFAKFFFILAAVIFVGFIIFKLFLSDGAFRRTTRAREQVTLEQQEELFNSESDFDKYIRLALAQKDYRLAYRYQYVRSLHAMAGKNHLVLSVDKTNFDYVKEMGSHPLRNDFASITLYYDYVWYGEFDIEEGTYLKMEKNILAFNNKI
jgi:hypothetical protein